MFLLLDLKSHKKAAAKSKDLNHFILTQRVVWFSQQKETIVVPNLWTNSQHHMLKNDAALLGVYKCNAIEMALQPDFKTCFYKCIHNNFLNSSIFLQLSKSGSWLGVWSLSELL